jgi:hypothetical protein
MAREPSAETVRAEAEMPAPGEAPGAPDDANYGFGRSRPLNPEEKQRLAREQGEAIASGRARKGHIVLNTPMRRAIFIGGLVGIVVLVLGLAILG